MALPSSGSLSLSQVNIELSFAANATISMGGAAVRGLFGNGSGAISMSNGYGKSSQFQMSKTLTSSIQNYNLRNDMVANGYEGSGPFTVNLTIASGVYIWSDSTGVPGFDTGALSGGTINILNDGFIIGKGGAGGHEAGNGAIGGPAMSLSHSVNITNNSYIAGGGGGGHGGLASQQAPGRSGGGGGAGGGAGGGSSAVPGRYAGAAGGAIGAKGGNSSGHMYSYSGAGGGRQLPGSGGVSTQHTTNWANTGGGAGGAGGGAVGFEMQNGPQPRASGSGGGGGGWGAGGGNRKDGSPATGPGGAGGATGGSSAGGAAGGKAIQLNGNSVTWNATGTVYGATS